jgi:L-cysteine desulfidase
MLPGNIIKNVKSVVVPGSGGMVGIEASAAMGIVAGDRSAEVEVKYLHTNLTRVVQNGRVLLDRGFSPESFHTPEEDRSVLSVRLIYELAKSIDLELIRSGIICDGAKPSCAMKIATGIYAAFDSATLASYHKDLHGGDGIVGSDVEATIRNIRELASKGMEQTDEVILKIMTSESGHGVLGRPIR